MNKRVKVGKISGVHGLKGDVKVTSYSDASDLAGIFNESNLLDVFLVPPSSKTGGAEKSVKVDSFKGHQSVLLVKFSGVSNRNDSEALKGYELEVFRDDLPKLGDGEFYLFDIIGLEVKDDSGVKIGVLKDVINAGAGDVYIIDRELDPKDENVGGTEILLPANVETILEINIEEGFIKVFIPEGSVS